MANAPALENATRTSNSSGMQGTFVWVKAKKCPLGLRKKERIQRKWGAGFRDEPFWICQYRWSPM